MGLFELTNLTDLTFIASLHGNFLFSKMTNLKSLDISKQGFNLNTNLFRSIATLPKLGKSHLKFYYLLIKPLERLSCMSVDWIQYDEFDFANPTHFPSLIFWKLPWTKQLLESLSPIIARLEVCFLATERFAHRIRCWNWLTRRHLTWNPWSSDIPLWRSYMPLRTQPEQQHIKESVVRGSNF